MKKYKVPMLDLRANYLSIKDEIDEAVSKVVSSGCYILGDHVSQFEEEVARYLGVKYAVGVASGTDALYLALRAAQPYGMIQTSTYTFIASAECVDRLGSDHCAVKPPLSLADINLCDYCMKPLDLGIESFIPVHLFGHPCHMDNLAYRNAIVLIEDCAQSFGAEYKGQKVGTIGTAGCFSFYPSKNLGCYGDGGLVVTQNKDIYEKIRSLRHHGTKPNDKYTSIYHGLNSRLDELQAAILSAKLPHIDEWNFYRRMRAVWYWQGLRECCDIILPKHKESGIHHSWNYYTIRCVDPTKRNDLQKYLASKGVETIVYFPVCIHQQPTFLGLYLMSGTFPNAELAARSCLSLPMYPELTANQVEYVCKCIREFFTKKV